MRLLAQAHMSLRALRGRRRADVTDADGDVRAMTEDGQEHTRVMIFGPVAPRGSPIARRERRTYTPQDAEQNWAACTHTRPGGKAGGQGRRDRTVRAGCGAGQRAEGDPAGQAAGRGAHHRRGSRLRCVLRLPVPERCPPETGLLLTCDGSAFPVLPGGAARGHCEGRSRAGAGQRGNRLAIGPC